MVQTRTKLPSKIPVRSIDRRIVATRVTCIYASDRVDLTTFSLVSSRVLFFFLFFPFSYCLPSFQLWFSTMSNVNE